MADLPSAKTSLDETAVPGAGGSKLIAILAPVSTNADITPRVFSSSAALLTQHGYAPGVDYATLHIEETGLPVMFVGLPIVTAGTVGRKYTAGNTGSSVVDVTVGGSGALEECDGIVKVVQGGTVGTSQIILDLSLDGGRSYKHVRLGTASSYTVPYVGQVLSFAAGTLVAGDTVLTWSSVAPLYDQAGLAAARTALVAQQKQNKTWLIVGQLSTAQQATDILTQVNGYETANDRFVEARASVRDRLPVATMSKVVSNMTGAPSLTFAEVGASGDTITRATGSWTADGFAVGDTIVVAGTANSNNVTAVIASLSATVITLGTEDLTPEVTSNASIAAYPTLTFAEVGASGDTITRNRGSWLDDGFRVGDKIVVTGSVSNNITALVGLVTVTATVLTLSTDDLAAEVIRTALVTLVAGETKAQWASNIDGTFASIDVQKRLDLGAGRARKQSLILGASLRRPVAWAASIREYQHAPHRATYRKADGPLDGWDLLDATGKLPFEFDERTDGGLLAARFTCFRTWANGPIGAFITLSLTRDTDNAPLSRTHNMHVANVACTTIQASSEFAIGVDLILNANGTATRASLAIIEGRANSDLAAALLGDIEGEGPAASTATWAASTDDDLRTPGAILNGTLTLGLKGTIEKIKTVVRVNANG